MEIFTAPSGPPTAFFPPRSLVMLCLIETGSSQLVKRKKNPANTPPRWPTPCCPLPSSPFLRVPLCILSPPRPHAAPQPQSGFCPCSPETALTLNSLETFRPSLSLGFHGPIHHMLPSCPWLFLPSLLCWFSYSLCSFRFGLLTSPPLPSHSPHPFHANCSGARCPVRHPQEMVHTWWLLNPRLTTFNIKYSIPTWIFLKYFRSHSSKIKLLLLPLPFPPCSPSFMSCLRKWPECLSTGSGQSPRVILNSLLSLTSKTRLDYSSHRHTVSASLETAPFSLLPPPLGLGLYSFPLE